MVLVGSVTWFGCFLVNLVWVFWRWLDSWGFVPMCGCFGSSDCLVQVGGFLSAFGGVWVMVAWVHWRYVCWVSV